MGDPVRAPSRLDDAAVGHRLSLIDEVLERVQAVPGPTAEASIEAVQALTEIYGEALARVLDHAGPDLAGHMVDDELLSHLLVLHELHPDPVERRVARAIDGIRPAVREHGGDVELAGIDDAVAKVRLSAKGCGSASAVIEEAVREVVLAAAPELSGVQRIPADGRDTAFFPLDALARRPVTAEGPT